MEGTTLVWLLCTRMAGGRDNISLVATHQDGKFTLSSNIVNVTFVFTTSYFENLVFCMVAFKLSCHHHMGCLVRISFISKYSHTCTDTFAHPSINSNMCCAIHIIYALTHDHTKKKKKKKKKEVNTRLAVWRCHFNSNQK